MKLVPVSQLEARRFIRDHHRHSKPPRAMICAVGLEQDGKLLGVGSLERPKAQKLCDGLTVEISRVCTQGAVNGCSRLYGALCRVAAALGYRRVVTYTLKTEPGHSLKASGFQMVAEVIPDTWDRRRLAAGHHQPDLFDAKYGETLARIRWERQVKA